MLLVVAVSIGLVYMQDRREEQAATGVTPAAPTLVSVDATNFGTYVEASKPTLIDVRTPEEFAAGHMDSAINIDFYASDFQTRIQELDPKGKYAVYCRSGNRSGQALEMMREMGFSSVINLTGGIVAWQASGKSLCTAATC